MLSVGMEATGRLGELVQAVLSHWPIGTHRPFEPAISIRADATIVVEFLFGGSSGGPIQCVATLLAYQHSLQQRRLHRAPRRMVSVFLQLLLSQGEDFFADQRRHRHLDPFLSWPLMARAVSTGNSAALPQRSTMHA